MKRVIRNNVFETNSSSCHSIQISQKSSMDYKSLRSHIDIDGILHIIPKEFGWEINTYRLPYTKIQYAFEMIIETEVYYEELKDIDNNYGLDVIYTTEGFQNLKDLLVSNIDECKDVVVDIDYNDSFNKFGYIDHQSHENYNSLQDFLNDYDVTLEEFIFDTGVVLKTDNDNH